MDYRLTNLKLETVVEILKKVNEEYLDSFAANLDPSLPPAERMKTADKIAQAVVAKINKGNREDEEDGRPALAIGRVLHYCMGFSRRGKKYVLAARENSYDFIFSLDASLAAAFFDAAGDHEKAEIQRQYYDTVSSWENIF